MSNCLRVSFVYFFLFLLLCFSFCFFFNDTATTEIYTLSLHDALPILTCAHNGASIANNTRPLMPPRSEEHTSELQSQFHLVCRLLLEKKKKKHKTFSDQNKKKQQNIHDKNIKRQ